MIIWLRFLVLLHWSTMPRHLKWHSKWHSLCFHYPVKIRLHGALLPHLSIMWGATGAHSGKSRSHYYCKDDQILIFGLLVIHVIVVKHVGYAGIYYKNTFASKICLKEVWHFAETSFCTVTVIHQSGKNKNCKFYHFIVKMNICLHHNIILTPLQ